jgi:hypothetical protein
LDQRASSAKFNSKVAASEHPANKSNGTRPHWLIKPVLAEEKFGKSPLPLRTRSNTMKRIYQAFLLCCGFILSSSALAEHQTYLRGILNVPGFQAALLEIHHTLVKPTNAPPVIITTSRLAREREQFEDETIYGGHFQFEVVEIDLTKETVKTREAGEEHIYTLPATDHPANASRWVHLQDAAFNDVIDLYSDLEKRVLLLHPAIDRAAVSLQVVWTNQTPATAEATHALLKYLNQRGISVVVDGSKFLQVIPSDISAKALPQSGELPEASHEIERMTLETNDAGDLARLYSDYSGRQRTGIVPTYRTVLYLKSAQPLSKPEVLYAVETLLGWYDAKIILGDDNTFKLEPTPQPPKRRQ